MHTPVYVGQQCGVLQCDDELHAVQYTYVVSHCVAGAASTNKCEHNIPSVHDLITADCVTRVRT